MRTTIFITIDEFKLICDLVQMDADLTVRGNLSKQLAHKLSKLDPDYGVAITADPSSPES